MSALDAAEERARRLVGTVELWTVPTIRREDLGTWAAVTHDTKLLDSLAQPQPVSVSMMYLVGQLQTHPWRPTDELRPDGLAERDSPGATAADPIAVLHGGGRVECSHAVSEGVAYRARREVVGVERKGLGDKVFLRVTIVTVFMDEHEMFIGRYVEYVLLREVVK